MSSQWTTYCTRHIYLTRGKRLSKCVQP